MGPLNRLALNAACVAILPPQKLVNSTNFCERLLQRRYATLFGPKA
ncbi:uncharacterized protein PGTG_01509 [Puccinia graminis f. sp. tritici CRL 75-36-700-3]|uniref:Uncharacterized protein n=1 Tax=Puccinia graminis f. sp. tritici (strain CRL 75-36-700-3 / race SCCL) TaxID=418459 RepID=E3JS45_PUCGT|nr:uncharacterized protein PGTG_01509 [Puccinia graminis f. sp. tritici CRL 75-36-700-3]EFP74916.1 hypothetical protein PGTG_01509 [Puccinia graminis f. sp. tritici CRL 75-36-700-3]